MMKIDRALTRPGGTVAYAVAPGDRGDVLFLHGAGMDHTIFRQQAQDLSRAGYRVVLCDLRGHGDSVLEPGIPFRAEDALEDVRELIRATGLERPVLIGHSLGGNLAQAYTRREPGAVGGVIILDSTWSTGPLSSWERMTLGLAAPLLRLIPASRLPAMMATASAVSPAAIAEAERIFARMSKPRFLEVWRATAGLVDPDPGYRTPVPLALVRGAQDRTGNIARAMREWADAEGAPEHVIPDAGHIVTLDAPDAASRVLLDTLAAWSPASCGPAS